MERFDLRRKETEKVYPDWAENENERNVYEAVNRRIAEIDQLIKSSTVPLSASERKIAKSVICQEIGLSSSYIAKHEKLNDYVAGHQRRLKRLSESLKEVRAQQQANAKRPEAMNKPELVDEVKKLKRNLDERSSELYVEQLKLILDGGLAESQVIVKKRIQSLQQEITRLRSHNSQLNSALQILKHEMVAVMKASKSHSRSILALLENADDPESVVQIMKTSNKRGK